MWPIEHEILNVFHTGDNPYSYVKHQTILNSFAMIRRFKLNEIVEGNKYSFF